MYRSNAFYLCWITPLEVINFLPYGGNLIQRKVLEKANSTCFAVKLVFSSTLPAQFLIKVSIHSFLLDVKISILEIKKVVFLHLNLNRDWSKVAKLLIV